MNPGSRSARIDSVLADSIEPARGGDERAWQAIYEALAPIVLGYLRARSAADPEDLLGEVFVQVVRDVDSFDGDAVAFRAWVMSIAHHRLLDSRRHRRRKPPGDPLPDTEGAGGLAPDAQTEALERLSLGEVTAALADLSEDQRAVLLLRVIGDLTVEQVAEVIGKRPGAVKAIQRRGLSALRARFGAGDG